MKCKGCDKPMGVVESYERGRRHYHVFYCSDCTIIETERGKLIVNKVGRGY